MDAKSIPVRFGGQVRQCEVTGVTSCKRCGADVYFVKTGNYHENGDPKTMPVDLKPDGNAHISHFATCPNASEFRGKK